MTGDASATPRRSRIEVVVPGTLLPAAIRDLSVPDLTPVRSPVVAGGLDDPADAAAVADALRSTNLGQGARVAVALGSRGLGAYPELVAGVLAALRAAGATPFLMPAMGSHGGGTPEGQRRVLTDYGLVPSGTTVDADDATRVVGRKEDGTVVHASQVALSADAIVVLNRVKSHTGFRGRVESGLTKMLVVGLGKRAGAAALHAKEYEGFASRLEQAREVLLRAYPPVIGVAVVEDATRRPARVEAVPGASIAEREPELLRDAKRRMPRLPFAKLDLLVVERAGKDVSGLGMDPNVTGRHPSGLHEPPDPTRIALLSLTDASEGNAIGMGLADVVPRSFADAIDPVATWTNAITSTSLASARRPGPPRTRVSGASLQRMDPVAVGVTPAPRHSSRITLSQSALAANLRLLRRKIGPTPIISSVVKANAFGHGIAAFVPMAERAGIRHFSVASSKEALQVQAARGHEGRVMIMGILYPEDLPWVIGHDIDFFVFDVGRLRNALTVARAVGKRARVHLEVETGGHRTGLTDEPFDEAVRLLRENPDALAFEGLATHFAGIESLANQFRIVGQQRSFQAFERRARAAGLEPTLRHTACSAAALGFPETVYDLVRIGTAQYGFWPSPDVYNMHLAQIGKERDNPLKRVLTWKTDVMDVKNVASGEFVGYGTAYQAPRDSVVAVLPVGYSDGYPRALSNRGHVLIRGRKARVVGLVNMNVTMVDVSDVPGVDVGDEVVLVGRQKRNAISVASFAEFSNALNNEFVSRLPAAIPRTPVS